MAASASDVVVVDNPAASRFEAATPEGLAVAEYVKHGTTIIFTHTEVPDAARGGGVANALARTALDAARRDGLTVVPRCPFFAVYVKRHHEYDDIVRPSMEHR